MLNRIIRVIVLAFTALATIYGLTVSGDLAVAARIFEQMAHATPVHIPLIAFIAAFSLLL